LGVLFVTSGLAPCADSAACLTALLFRSAFVSDVETSLNPKQVALPGDGTAHAFSARKAACDSDADADGLAVNATATAASRAAGSRAPRRW
jgi:hypothetical protein